jgi:hypothetical protein
MGLLRFLRRRCVGGRSLRHADAAPPHAPAARARRLRLRAPVARRHTGPGRRRMARRRAAVPGMENSPLGSPSLSSSSARGRGSYFTVTSSSSAAADCAEILGRSSSSSNGISLYSGWSFDSKSAAVTPKVRRPRAFYPPSDLICP